jgi:hypothetical protein
MSIELCPSSDGLGQFLVFEAEALAHLIAG